MKNIKDTIQHLRDHQRYPATKDELIAACNNLSDFSEADKREFAERLPEGMYNSADEVINALELQRA